MNKQPYAVSSNYANYDRTEDFVRAAKKSGKKEAEARERSQQILDYYREEKRRKIKI